MIRACFYIYIYIYNKGSLSECHYERERERFPLKKNYEIEKTGRVGLTSSVAVSANTWLFAAAFFLPWKIISLSPFFLELTLSQLRNKFSFQLKTMFYFLGVFSDNSKMNLSICLCNMSPTVKAKVARWSWRTWGIG